MTKEFDRDYYITPEREKRFTYDEPGQFKVINVPPCVTCKYNLEEDGIECAYFDGDKPIPIMDREEKCPGYKEEYK